MDDSGETAPILDEADIDMLSDPEERRRERRRLMDRRERDRRARTEERALRMFVRLLGRIEESQEALSDGVCRRLDRLEDRCDRVLAEERESSGDLPTLPPAAVQPIQPPAQESPSVRGSLAQAMKDPRNWGVACVCLLLLADRGDAVLSLLRGIFSASP